MADNLNTVSIKQSDAEARALELWGIWSTPLLCLLSSSTLAGAIAPDRVLYLFDM